MEGTFEQLVEWARADLPELGASERLAAIRCVVEGDYLSALHIYDLIELADSKGMKESIDDGTYNKSKALHKWLYMLVGGPYPRSLGPGYDKALVARITRACNKGGRRPILLNFRGAENQEARERHLRAWAEAWAQEAYPPGTLDGVEGGAVAPFKRADDAYRAMVQGSASSGLELQPPVAVAATSPAAADGTSRTTPFAVLVAVAEGQQERMAAAASQRKEPEEPHEVRRLRHLLDKERLTSQLLLSQKVAKEEQLQEAQGSACGAERNLRRQLRGVESELATVRADAATAIEKAERECSAAVGQQQLTSQRLKEQLRELQAVLRAREDLHTSSLAMQRENELQARELKRARDDMQEERGKRQQTERELCATQSELEASRAASAAAKAEAAAAARAAEQRHAGLLAEKRTRGSSESERLRAQLKAVQATETSRAQLELDRNRLQRMCDSMVCDIGSLRAELHMESEARELQRASADALKLELRAAQQHALALHEELHGHRILAGRAQAKRQREEAAAQKEAEERVSKRQLERALSTQQEERAKLLAVRDELMEKIRSLEAELQGSAVRGRGKRPIADSGATQQVELVDLRGGKSHLDGFVLEMLRRLVEECGVPFSAVPTANVLVLAMHMRKVPPPQMLLTDTTVRNAFKRLGLLDKKRVHARNSASPIMTPWAPAADAGETRLFVFAPILILICMYYMQVSMQAV